MPERVAAAGADRARAAAATPRAARGWSTCGCRGAPPSARAIARGVRLRHDRPLDLGTDVAGQQHRHVAVTTSSTTESSLRTRRPLPVGLRRMQHPQPHAAAIDGVTRPHGSARDVVVPSQVREQRSPGAWPGTRDAQPRLTRPPCAPARRRAPPSDPDRRASRASADSHVTPRAHSAGATTRAPIRGRCRRGFHPRRSAPARPRAARAESPRPGPRRAS